MGNQEESYLYYQSSDLVQDAKKRRDSGLTVSAIPLSKSNHAVFFREAITFRTLLWICLLLNLLTPTATFAQTQAEIDAAQRQSDIIQRQEQERLLRDQEAARRLTDRVDGMDTEQLLPKIELPGIGVVCREINVIIVSGAPNLSDTARKRITDDYSGRCLNVGDIEGILSEITKDYIDRGYITTRAYLPPQDLSTGRLEILVIEGVVEKIMIEDGDANSISIGNAFPGMEGNLLNLRDLEQGIDQINRLASNNAQLDIRPGEKPGASQVVVYNQPRSRFHFNITADNQGSESTGDEQTGLTVTADNLLGFNDLLSVTHRESTPSQSGRKLSKSDNLYFSIPFGYSTLSLGISRSEYFSPVDLPSGLQLISSGDSKTNNIRLDRVVYRDQSTRVLLAATLTTKDSNNFLDGQFLEVSSRKLTVLDVDGNFNTGLAGGVLSVDVGYAQGLKIAGALEDPDFLPNSSPHAQFSKFKAGFYYARPFRLFDKDFSFSSQFTAQKARDVLYGSEQMSIGGLYSVRGFVSNILSGDDGYYWRNEVSVRQSVTLGSEVISTRIYAGYDTGEVSNRADDIPEGRLAGMVIGVAGNWRGASLELSNTRPLTLPDTMTKESNQTWFRVSYAF